MDLVEIVAAALGLANIVLLVRRSIWNYPFGLAMVTLYAWVFARERLYSDALLQGLFFAVQVAGWIGWRASREAAGEVVVRRLGPIRLAAVLGVAAAAGLAWGALIARVTDAALPYADGANAAFSVAAQILLARRFIENWPVWIGVDVLAIGIYLSRGLLATAALYVALLAMSAVGWRAWRAASAAGAAA